MDDYMLTTYDNPINPFENFEGWFKRDLELGYNTCGLLAKRSNTSINLGDEVNEKFIDDAVEEIIKDYPLTFKKIYKD